MGLIQNKVTVSQPNSHVVVKNAGGLRGLTGETGPQGPQGVPGEAATVTAGTTTTLPAGSNATVQNVGSTSAAIFNFGIPKGDKGDTGESGAAATISVGSTSTLPAGSSATVTNSGTSSAAVFDFGIPKGDKGDTGATGADGYSPSATVTKTGDTATITITDKDGTTTASISDGTTPTVNDGTLTIQKNGTTVQTFSADQASNVTANITVPTQFSELSGTVSSSQIEDEAITTGSVSGSGTNIELDGTIAGGAIESIQLKGDTEQTTYSGKNLVNAPETFTFNRNYLNFQQFSAGTYYVSCGNVTKGGANDPQIGDSKSHIAMTSNMLNQILNFTGTGLTVYSNGWSWGDSSVNSTVEKLIITTSPISSLDDYEPYVGGTASPNPDYPQEVQTVTGRQVVTISDGGSESQEYEINLGKNLLDNYNPTIVSANTTWTPTENGGLYTATSGWTGGVQWKLTVEEGSTYQLQYKERTDQNLYLYITTYTDSTYTTVKTRLVNDGRYTKYPIVPDSPYLEIQFNNSAAMTDVAIEELMLEKASTRTTYAPYFTPIELCKIGTYQDYIYKSGEDWYVHKEIGRVLLDGSDTSNYGTLGNGTGGTKRFRYSRSDIGNVPDTIRTTYCDMYQGIQRRYTLDIPNSISQYTQQNMLNITTSSTTYTLGDYLSFLSSNPATVYYALATPTDTQITNAALISELNALNAGTTYDGTTIITVSSENLAGPLEVVAEADSKLAPDSVYGAAIKDGAVSVDKIADLKALADALAPYLNS